MISVHATVADVANNMKSWVRHYAFHEMKQIASGWGLNNTYPAPDADRPSAIQIHVSTRSRRTLLKFH